MIENLTELFEAVAVLVGLAASLVAILVRLYVKHKKEQATFQDLAASFDDALDVARDFMDSGKARDLEEGAEAAARFLEGLREDDRPLPKKVAARLRQSLRTRIKAKLTKDKS